MPNGRLRRFFARDAARACQSSCVVGAASLTEARLVCFFDETVMGDRGRDLHGLYYGSVTCPVDRSAGAFSDRCLASAQRLMPRSGLSDLVLCDWCSTICLRPFWRDGSGAPTLIRRPTLCAEPCFSGSASSAH